MSIKQIDLSKLTSGILYASDNINFIKYDETRNVGTESKGSYLEKINNGFFDKYMQDKGLDIGFAGYKQGCLPILEGAIGIDKDYPGYDGINLPFLSETQHYIYSSHCLEHIDNYKLAIMEWYRVLKFNGYMIIIVPHQYAYEKRVSLPSRFNGDHKRFYSPAKLLNEIEESLEPNSYRIESLRDNVNSDLKNFPPSKHSNAPYEIELVIKKILKPTWELEDS